MKLGISSHSFGWAAGAVTFETKNKMTPFELMDFAFENNIQLVQIADNMPLHGLSDDVLFGLKRSAIEKNIEIELGIKGLTNENLHNYIKLCEFFNCRLLRIVTDAKGYEPSLEEIVKILIEYVPIIESKNIRIAIENHDRFKSDKLALIVEHVNSPNVGICLDTANSLIASEGIEYVQQVLKAYVLNLHVKDYKIKRLPYLMGFTVEGRPAGDGDVDIDKLLKKVDEDVNVIIELWTTPEDRMEKTIQKEREWVVKSILYMREFISM